VTLDPRRSPTGGEGRGETGRRQSPCAGSRGPGSAAVRRAGRGRSIAVRTRVLGRSEGTGASPGRLPVCPDRG